MKKNNISFDKIINPLDIETTKHLKINSSINSNKKNIPLSLYNITNRSSLLSLEKRVYKNLKNKYEQTNCYNLLEINKILDGVKCRIVAKFKDSLIFLENIEFVKKYYPIELAKNNLKNLLNFYFKYSCIFPNYVILPQKKFIYNNLGRKQRLINNIIKFKNIQKKDRESIQIFDTNVLCTILNQTNTSNINKKILGIDTNNKNNENENSSMIKDFNKILSKINEINIVETERINILKKKSNKKTHERCSTNGNNCKNSKYYKDICLKYFNYKNNNKNIKENNKIKNKKTQKRNNSNNSKKLNIKKINVKCIQNLSVFDIYTEKTNRNITQYFYSIFSTKDNITKNLKSSHSLYSWNNNVKKIGKYSLSLSHNKKQIIKQNKILKKSFNNSLKISPKIRKKNKTNTGKCEKIVIMIKKSKKSSKNKKSANFKKYSKEKHVKDFSLYETENNKTNKNKGMVTKNNIYNIMNKGKILNLNTYKLHSNNYKKTGKITPINTCPSTWSAKSNGKITAKDRIKRSTKSGIQYQTPPYELLSFDSNPNDNNKNKCLNNIRYFTSMNPNQSNYIIKQNNNYGNINTYKGVLFEKYKKIENNNVVLTENNILQGIRAKSYKSPLTTRTSQNTSTKNFKKELKDNNYFIESKINNKKTVTQNNCKGIPTKKVIKTNKNNYFVTYSSNMYGYFKRTNVRKNSNN